MPARSPNAAVDAALDRVRRVASCITDRPVLASGYRPSTTPHSIGFAPRGQPVVLATTSGRRGPLLTMDHQYGIVRTEDAPAEYDLRTVGYVYTLLDLQERELIAYHWHPVGRSHVTARHLHLSNQVPPLDLGRGAGSVALADMHLPTGSIWLADLVRLLIGEFGIEPRRSDWQTVLQQMPPIP